VDERKFIAAVAPVHPLSFARRSALNKYLELTPEGTVVLVIATALGAGGGAVCTSTAGWIAGCG
jgi:hypothetical protein